MTPELIKRLEGGFAAQQRGDLETAGAAYRRVLDADPLNEFALNLLGVVLVRMGRYPEALDYLEAAVKTHGGDPETRNNLGLALSGLHRYDEAVVAFRHALGAGGENAEVLNNLGNALAATDRHAEAIPCFERALTVRPLFPACRHNLAISLLAADRPQAALAAIDAALSAEPERTEFLVTRGEILMREGRYEEARENLERAIAQGDSVRATIHLSTVLKQLRDYEAARSTLEDVLHRQPDNAEAHHHLGVLHGQRGDSAAAAVALRAALGHNPRHASAYYQLAKLRNERLTGEEVRAVRAMLADPACLEALRPPLLFALGCEAEKDGDYRAGMDFFKQAQAIKASRNPYDGKATEAYVEACRRVFPARAEPVVQPQRGEPVPVFIIGMPRSGTTLTEQILSCHSQVAGAGEVGFINELVMDLAASSKAPFPDCLSALEHAEAMRLRQRYFSSMRARCGEAAYVLDKNPLNYHFVGFILKLFPEAKLLFCRRDPIDNCVSIFRLPFDDNQGYSHDLAALGHCYRAHSALMDLWQRHYAGSVLAVDYEDTVADLEGSVRRMAAFLGLPPEPSMLRYYDNDRVVLTPSADQVRQPIYTTSVGLWRRYEDAIDPLLRALGLSDQAHADASLPSRG
jgi:tetratricopeptide (TPR) repeat protein